MLSTGTRNTILLNTLKIHSLFKKYRLINDVWRTTTGFREDTNHDARKT